MMNAMHDTMLYVSVGSHIGYDLIENHFYDGVSRLPLRKEMVILIIVCGMFSKQAVLTKQTKSGLSDRGLELHALYYPLS